VRQQVGDPHRTGAAVLGEELQRRIVVDHRRADDSPGNPPRAVVDVDDQFAYHPPVAKSHHARAKVASHAYVNPLVAVALGYFAAGEVITLRIVLASALVIASVFLILKNDLHHA
jgi:hypothetical protein